MIECISKNGMTSIKKKRSSVTVMRKARPRAKGLMVFDISQSINSTSTVANATVDAKVSADMRLMVDRECPPLDENGRAYEPVLKEPASPDRNGKIFWRTRVDTKRNVAMNGKEENTMAVGVGIAPGLHSPQSSSHGSMGDHFKSQYNSATYGLHEFKG